MKDFGCLHPVQNNGQMLLLIHIAELLVRYLYILR